MKAKIAVIKGDGIGPEIVSEAVDVLRAVGDKFGHSFEFEEVLAGGIAIDECGECLPKHTLEVCKASDAVLLGAVGGPKWDKVPGDKRPERALLGLRSNLGLYANLRPALMFSCLKGASPLKCRKIENGLDILIVRELTGGIYFGKSGRVSSPEAGAYDVEEYSVSEIERIAKVAFSLAEKRSKKLTLVDKANVLESSRLWREVVSRIAEVHPDVELNYMYVDNAAMQLVANPSQFDVILTNNIFGDILSDEASMITGSIGMLASASLGDGSFGMYEPIHGSAPDIAGQGIANPCATILSAAMMLRYTFGLKEEAQAVENAVNAVLEAGYRTKDIMQDEMKLLSTREMGEKIIAEI